MSNIAPKEKQKQILESGVTYGIIGCIAGGIISGLINKPDLAIPLGAITGFSLGILGAIRKWAQFPGL